MRPSQDCSDYTKDVNVPQVNTRMLWRVSDRFDPSALPLANAHYNRQTPESPQFVPPGKCTVLLAGPNDAPDALWVTSWPQFARHAWAGAWVNTLFRNESSALASELIAMAVSATLGRWDAPPLGIITFVDAAQVRHKRDPGRCYLKAGWKHVGYTQGGLYTFQQLPHEMPAADTSLVAPLFC